MDEIQTDVDRLIHALQSAPGQHLTFAQLERELHLTTTQIKKWVGILESEKRVRVHYTFGDIHVTWIYPHPGAHAYVTPTQPAYLGGPSHSYDNPASALSVPSHAFAPQEIEPPSPESAPQPVRPVAGESRGTPSTPVSTPSSTPSIPVTPARPAQIAQTPSTLQPNVPPKTSPAITSYSSTPSSPL